MRPGFVAMGLIVPIALIVGILSLSFCVSRATKVSQTQRSVTERISEHIWADE